MKPVRSPVATAKLKTKALRKYIESKMGLRGTSDIDYCAVVINEGCDLHKSCLHSKLLACSQDT